MRTRLIVLAVAVSVVVACHRPAPATQPAASASAAVDTMPCGQVIQGDSPMQCGPMHRHAAGSGRMGMGTGMHARMGMGHGMRVREEGTPGGPPADSAHASHAAGESDRDEDDSAGREAATCPAVSPELVSRGATIFGGAGNCVVCHGREGAGTAMAPRLSDRQWLWIDGSYESVAALVRTGVMRPKQYPGMMPARGGAPLSDAEVCAVAGYVYAQSH